MRNETVIVAPGGLNAAQIAWLRERVPNFDHAWQAVRRADHHAALVRARLDRHPNAVPLSMAADKGEPS